MEKKKEKVEEEMLGYFQGVGEENQGTEQRLAAILAWLLQLEETEVVHSEGQVLKAGALKLAWEEGETGWLFASQRMAQETVEREEAY